MRDCRDGVSDDDVLHAVNLLRNGGAVVYPTETLYGLGVDALNESALVRLADLKVRDAHKPISVLVSDDRMLHGLVETIPPKARVLIERFWPGPLTMVFAARPELPAALTAGSGSIGARISSHPTAQALVTALGRPLTSPSANPAGQPPPKRIEDARAYFGGRVECYLDAGPLPGEPASTVVDVRGDLRLVRPGAIDFEILQNVQGTD
jgi:L-threonylcarbamoyladenylate synthase